MDNPDNPCSRLWLGPRPTPVCQDLAGLKLFENSPKGKHMQLLSKQHQHECANHNQTQILSTLSSTNLNCHVLSINHFISRFRQKEIRALLEFSTFHYRHSAALCFSRCIFPGVSLSLLSESLRLIEQKSRMHGTRSQAEANNPRDPLIHYQPPTSQISMQLQNRFFKCNLKHSKLH